LDLFVEIQQVICEQLKVKPEEVRSETNLIGDLGVDSLDTVELIMALEEKFDVEIPDEDAEKMETVNDVVKYIEKKINKTPEAED
jgi:acyl carrier protein